MAPAQSRMQFSPVNFLGWALLVVWCIWWGANLLEGRVFFLESTWVHIPAFGYDFSHSIDKAVRLWMSSRDPYLLSGNGPFDREAEVWFSYPPIMLRLFPWIPLVSSEVSVRIWIGALVAFIVIGALAVVKSRRELGLEPIPASLVLALVLFSTPAIFALERSNYDLMIVPLIVGALSLARRKTSEADAAAGFLLAMAIWAKLYPGLLIFALIAMGKWRLLGWLLAALTLIGLMDLPQLLLCLKNMTLEVQTAKFLNPPSAAILSWNHPLTLYWPKIWAGTPLALIPGALGAALTLGPLFTWVSWRVYRADNRDEIATGYCFWVVALASFAPVVANDYSLSPLPLAALAVWSPRDGWPARVALAALLVWWQPVDLHLPARLIMVVKLAGLVGVGFSLVQRALVPRPSHQTSLEAQNA